MGEARFREPPPWTETAVRAFLAGYSRNPGSLQVRQMESWWTNVVLLLDTEAERLVLRRYGTTPPEEVLWELALLEHLRAHDFPTIRPLPRFDGSRLSEFMGAPAILYPYIEAQPAHYASAKSPEAITEAAALAGRLSRLTQGLVLPYPRVRAGTGTRQLLVRLGEVLEQRGIGPDEPGLSGFAAHAASEIRDMDARLRPYAGRLPAGIVHHDAHPGNVLFRDGKAVALIDFDDAYAGYLVDEVPVMLEGWATDRKKHALLPEEATAVLRAYHTERPLTLEERALLLAALPFFILGDAAAGLLEWIGRGRPGEEFIGRSESYSRYLALRASDQWRKVLSEALASLPPG